LRKVLIQFSYILRNFTEDQLRTVLRNFTEDKQGAKKLNKGQKTETLRKSKDLIVSVLKLIALKEEIKYLCTGARCEHMLVVTPSGFRG